MGNSKRNLVWITPDYFLNVDAKIVPQLAPYYPIDWILITRDGSERSSAGLLTDAFRPREYRLPYRFRDPRLATHYASLLSSIRKSRYSLLYTSFHGLPYFFPIVASLMDVHRVIYAVHNVHTPRGAAHEHSMRLYQRYAFRVFKRFHVFSRFQLRTIARMLPNKCHYYAPFIPDDYGESHAAPPSDRIRFTSFGYIRKYKRVDLLIQAFKSLYDEGFTDIELVIAGQCDDWTPYEAQINSHPAIHARIGIVPNSDIPDVIASSHYLVLPYQDGAQSGVLPLAYRYGRPVITSDIEAFGDAVVEGKTGYRFQALSPESLRQVMRERILQHRASYETLTRDVRAHFDSEYALPDIVTRYRAFLDSALSETAR